MVETKRETIECASARNYDATRLSHNVASAWGRHKTETYVAQDLWDRDLIHHESNKTESLPMAYLMPLPFGLPVVKFLNLCLALLLTFRRIPSTRHTYTVAASAESWRVVDPRLEHNVWAIIVWKRNSCKRSTPNHKRCTMEITRKSIPKHTY